MKYKLMCSSKALSMCFVCLFFCLVSYSEIHAQNSGLDIMRRNILNAGAQNTKAKAFKKCFKRIGLSGIAELKQDRDTSIALQAAWECSKKVIERNPKIRHRTNWVLDPIGTQRFLGFLEGRLQIQTPKWWEERFMDSGVFPRRNIYFSDHYSNCYIDTDLVLQTDYGELHIGAPKGMKIKMVESGIHFESGENSITISANACTEEIFNPDPRNVLWVPYFGPEKFFLVMHRNRRGQFPICCFNRKTKKLEWEAEIWGPESKVLQEGDSGRRGGGHWTQTVSVMQVDKIVYIFGRQSSLYLEGFDVKTGNLAFRFSTDYWNHDSEAWELK